MASETPRRRAHSYLSGLLFVMGALHFVAPKPFDGIVPPQLPGGPRGQPDGGRGAPRRGGAARGGISSAIP
ncbi:hypothetical protein [Nocardia neocaledoniensis]|uniref:hypothetical protein n=1 Tax=Nocardia neocaledoniensis TaxID=236511 RepID=UPI00245875A0|nr:hypothetical protein [Nocardia neocaledoniensis]